MSVATRPQSGFNGIALWPPRGSGDEGSLHPRDGCHPRRLPVRRRRVPGDHHHHHSVRRVHPLRAQQRGVVAGADGRAADDRAVVPVGRRLLPRISAHRRRRPAGVARRSRPNRCSAGSSKSACSPPTCSCCGRGIKLVRGDLVPEHRRIPDRLGRHRLPADPDRRRAHGAVRDRALPDRQNSSRSRSRKP